MSALYVCGGVCLYSSIQPFVFISDQTPTPGPATPAAPTPQNETAPSPQGSAHGQNSNMPWWMDNDIAALPAGFDWSADAFDGWFSFEDTSGLGMNHMNHGEV